MILYAESSAVLGWLLGEEGGRGARELLAAADFVLSSDLTLIEVDRVLHRAVREGHLIEADAAARRARWARAVSAWTLLRIGPGVIQRAREPFPAEPIRSLDAIHLASAMVARKREADVAMLSLDRRVRSAAVGLGFPVLPEGLLGPEAD